MSREKLSTRLGKIVKEVSEKERLSEEQLNTILALIDEIKMNGGVSSDYLVRIFDAIGGGN